MKWFYGCFSLGGNIDEINIFQKYSEYYNIPFDGIEKKIERKYLYYIEINTHGTQILTYEHEDFIILGDIHLHDNSAIGGKDIALYIINLYKMYGAELANHLYGYFSLILIDKKKYKINLIRDQFGIQQLFYHIKERTIYFANYLFLLDGCYIKNKISKRFLEKFYEYNGLCLFSETPYKDIYRVKAAESIFIDSILGTSQSSIYWSLSKSKSINDLSFEEAQNEIRNILENHIQNEVLEYSHCGISLSGGLDSSILFSLLSKKNICAFSAVFDKLKSCDERVYIEELKKKSSKIRYVKADDCGLLEGYPESYFYTSEPHINVLNKSLSEVLFTEIKENGLKYVIDGFFSDHIFTGNIIYIIDELKKGKLIKSFNEIKYYGLATNQNFWEVIKNYIIPSMVNRENIPGIDEKIIKSSKNELASIRKYNGKDILVQISSAIARNFGDHELAPRYGIECIHPFVNRRLVELLYVLPGEYRMKNGIPKYILREAYKQELPESIRVRVNKTQHVELSQSGLRKNWGNIYETLRHSFLSELNLFELDKDKWLHMLQKFRSGVIFNDEIFIFMALEIWMYKLKKEFGNIMFF